MTKFYRDIKNNSFILKNEDSDLCAHISSGLYITLEDIDLESKQFYSVSPERFKSWIGDYKLIFLRIFKDD